MKNNYRGLSCDYCGREIEYYTLGIDGEETDEYIGSVRDDDGNTFCDSVCRGEFEYYNDEPSGIGDKYTYRGVNQWDFLDYCRPEYKRF